MTFYEGSHAVALTETMRQTERLTGAAFPGGIFINYIFLIVWTVDVAWWWVAPQSYRSRARWISLAIRGFIFFIIVNGAVVFADGWARVVGVAAATLALFGVWRRGRELRRRDRYLPTVRSHPSAV
jgi:hypothetical protein